MLKWCSLLLFIFLAVSCGGSVSEPDSQDASPVPAAALGEPFTLRLNQGKRVQQFEISFVDVTEDSRCPRNARCVWQGQVTVELAVSRNGVDLAPLTLSTDFDATAALETYEVALTGVEPGPALAGESIPLSDYIITLVVTEGVSQSSE